MSIEEAILLDTLRCRLNFLRTKKDYSKEHVANQLNISLEQYENYEEGEVLPTIFELIDLSILYQVSLDYLVGRTEE